MSYEHCNMSSTEVDQYFSRKYNIESIEGPGNIIKITNPKNNKSITINKVLLYRHPSSVVRLRQADEKFATQSLRPMDIELYLQDSNGVTDATKQ